MLFNPCFHKIEPIAAKPIIKSNEIHRFRIYTDIAPTFENVTIIMT